MTSAFPLHRYTYQDYVWLEQESSTRHCVGHASFSSAAASRSVQRAGGFG